MKKQIKKAVGRPLQKEKTGWLRYSAGLVRMTALLVISLSFSACRQGREELSGKNPVDVFPSVSNRVIVDWNNTLFEVLEAPHYLNTLTASRLAAMVHIAQHDALNAIVPEYEKYTGITNDAGAHPVAAAAVAAHTVLLHHLPAKKQMLDLQLAKTLDTIVNAISRDKGIVLGKQAGQAILILRKDDGAFQDPVAPVTPSGVPGVYQAVPPFDFVFGPFWKTMKPFGLLKPEQFRSAPLPGLQSAVYKKDFEEVKLFGEKSSTARTTDQTFYAKFWYEFSEIGWNRIARVAAGMDQTDLISTARLFAMLNIALADSYTAGWDSKFHYNFWRPYTAIRSGNTAQWEPLLPTPPVQEYPSTHSVLGNAGATVLTYFYGNDFEFAFSSSSSPTAETVRTFRSFLRAADENADSRVMAGIHFRFSCEAGQEMGNKIGKWVIENTLQRER